MGYTKIFQTENSGRVLPFSTNGIPLSTFIQEYADFSGIRIAVAEQLKMPVYLKVSTPIGATVLEEYMHQVFANAGLAAVDAPEKTGWVLMKLRDAREAQLPIYDSKDFPETSRLVTVVHRVRSPRADSIAKWLRNFMTMHSRIIASGTQTLIITDHGRNIKKYLELIRTVDVSKTSRGGDQ